MTALSATMNGRLGDPARHAQPRLGLRSLRGPGQHRVETNAGELLDRVQRLQSLLPAFAKGHGRGAA